MYRIDKQNNNELKFDEKEDNPYEDNFSEEFEDLDGTDFMKDVLNTHESHPIEANKNAELPSKEATNTKKPKVSQNISLFKETNFFEVNSSNYQPPQQSRSSNLEPLHPPRPLVIDSSHVLNSSSNNTSNSPSGSPSSSPLPSSPPTGPPGQVSLSRHRSQTDPQAFLSLFSLSASVRKCLMYSNLKMSVIKVDSY